MLIYAANYTHPRYGKQSMEFYVDDIWLEYGSGDVGEFYASEVGECVGFRNESGWTLEGVQLIKQSSFEKVRYGVI